MEGEMNESDTIILKKDKESSAFGISIRGWIAWTAVITVCANQIIPTVTACYLSLLLKDMSLLGSQSAVTEPLYGVVYMAVGYYFAKQTMPMTTKPNQ
jgi:hypothetical protein